MSELVVELDEITKVIQAKKWLVDQAQRRAYETKDANDQQLAENLLHKLDGAISVLPYPLRTQNMAPTPIEDLVEMSPALIEAKAQRAHDFFLDRQE